MVYEQMTREQLINELRQKDRLLKKLELIFNYTSTGIVIGSANGRTLEFMNPAFAKMHGYTVEELTGKPIADVFEPEYRPKLAGITAKVHQNGAYEFECRHIRKDGTLFPVRVESTAVYGEDGAALYRIVNVKDITERKRIEDELQKSEILYRTIFETGSTAMAIIESNGIYALVNKEFEKMFGYSKAEAENQLHWEKIVAPDNLAKVRECRRTRLNDPDVTPRGYEFTAVNKSGALIDVYGSFSLIPGSGRIIASYLDITDRKQSEEALGRATREKLLILDGISELVIYCDQDMKIRWVNRAASNLIGLTNEQLQGRHCHEVFYGSGKVCANCQFYGVIKTGQTVAVEIKKVWGRTFLVRGYPVWDQDGVIIGIIHIMMYLTERKQLELALTESENKFKSVYQAANVGITLVGLDGKIIDSNRAFQRMLGFNGDELIGLQCSDITFEEDHGLDDQLFKELVAGKRKSFQMEKRYRRKDGQLIWVRLNVSTVKDGSGQVRYAIGVVEDITQRKQAIMALRASEEKFRLLFHNANDAIFLYDAGDKNKPGRFIEVNNVACYRLGYGREELLKMTILDLNPVENSNFILNFFHNVIQNGSGMTETIHVTKTGVRIPAEVNAHLFTLGDARVILSIARDLTERKKAETELTEARIKANRAERLASLGTLAAGIVHEMSQPLNALKIVTDGLLYLYSINKTLDPGEVVEDLNKISNQVERIESIINRIRSFVSGEHSTQFDYCSLNEAVEESLNMIDYQLSARGINVVKSLFQPLPPIWADQNKLEEVVINLTINAMQALDATGKEDKEIRIVTDYTDNVVLEISDNATGVNQNIVQKIFEPFFTTKKVGEGMGLGLSIVHSIVTSFDGQIYVHQSQTGGAAFRIQFPVAQQKKALI